MTLMKSLSLPTFLTVLVLGISGIKAQAQMFGSSYTIGNVTYSYDASNDDGTYQTDIYLDGNGGSLELRGRIGATVGLAEVTGAFTGFLSDGVIHPWTEETTPEGFSFTSPDGRVYTERFDRTTYTVDLDQDALASASVTVYAGAQGEFYAPVNGENGNVWGAENGYVVNGSLLLDETTHTTWTLAAMNSPVPLFGGTYYRTSLHTVSGYDSIGEGRSSLVAHYASVEGGSFTYQEGSDSATTTVSMSGNDPYVGNWAAAGGTPAAPEFSPLGAAVFAPEAFWVNGKVVNWTETLILSPAGSLSSSYAGDGITVTITGNARQFKDQGAAAVVEVAVDGGGVYTGSILEDGTVQGFDAAECDVQLADPNRDTPLFAPGTLYVDGTPFGFTGGYEDSAGTRTDHYDHDGAVLSLVGAMAAPSTAAVRLGAEEGTFLNGVFNMPGCAILSTLLEGPPAFWVNGVLFTKNPGSTAYSSAGSPPQWFSLSGEDMTVLVLSGTLSGATLAGTYNAEQGGVFNVTLGGVTRLACPAETTGEMRQGPALNDLTGEGGPHLEFAGLPAAVRVPVIIPAGDASQRLDVVLDFLGLATDDDASGDLVACYGKASGEPTAAPAGYWQQHLVLLKIRASTGTAKVVTLRDYQAAKTSDGSYDTGTRLFETALRAADAVVQPLPLPIMSLEPPSYAFWLMDATPPGGLPRSFIIRGQPWWYAGEVGGQPVYRGFYDGQQMSLGTADASGQRLVTLTDPAFQNGATTQGTLSDVRRSVRLRDGTLALSGNPLGGQEIISYQDEFALHTIRADLDILGNNLSFGALNDDVSLAGMAWRFEHRAQDGMAVLHSMLSRAQAEWVWWKAGALPGRAHELQPVMQIDTANRLNLFPPGGDSTTTPGITLDPSAGGTSTIRGVLRVRPGGDIDMGEFTAGGEP
jgi:hypothetical protein